MINSFNKQDNKHSKNKIKNLDSFTVNRRPTSNNELPTKNYINDKIKKNTILRFNQTLEIYIQISVENDVDNLTKNIYKLQIQQKLCSQNKNNIS